MKNTAAQQAIIPASTLNFLQLLKKNNTREWFTINKEDFLRQQGFIESFAEAMLTALNHHDVIETISGKNCLQRIYRDVRFSASKVPYKTSWNGGFKRASSVRRGGYYFHIEPGNTFITGGFRGPGPADLKRIREDIAFDAAPLRAILRDKTFVAMFGTLQGALVQTTPKGFDAAHEAIDLLRYKQFLLTRKFTDAQVTSSDFLSLAGKTFQAMRPFFDYMSEVLSTGTNGTLPELHPVRST